MNSDALIALIGSHDLRQWLALYAASVTGLVSGLLIARAPPSRRWSAPLIAIPATVMSAVLMTMLGRVIMHITPDPTRIASILEFAGPVLAAALAALVGIAGARQRGDHAVKRGTVILDAPRSARPRSGHLTLAGQPVPPADEAKHFKMIGTTGTGKSTAIRELLGGALRRGDRAVIADPDGGYLRQFYDPTRGDVILNPFDPRAHAWNPYGEIIHAHDVEQLARSLIPDHDGSDRSWRGYARTFFTAVARQTFDAGIRDLAELHRLLTCASIEELRILTTGTPAQPFLEGGNERMFGSIRSVTGSQLTALEYLATQPGPRVAVRDWVRRGRGVLFMPYRANEIAALRSVISAWLRLAIFECMNQEEGDQRLWFVVDELDALGVIDGLKDALARLRKFGGRCVLGFQSIAQVSSTYGQGEAQTIVENCGNSLILRCSSSENGGTARFASKLIGEREVIRPTISRSRRSGLFVEPHQSVSRGEQHVLESAVLPAQIEQLPDLSGYLKFASSAAWLRVRLDLAQPPPR